MIRMFIMHSGSGFFSIPDPGVIKTPDPGSNSQTLHIRLIGVTCSFKSDERNEPSIIDPDRSSPAFFGVVLFISWEKVEKLQRSCCRILCTLNFSMIRSGKSFRTPTHWLKSQCIQYKLNCSLPYDIFLKNNLVRMSSGKQFGRKKDNPSPPPLCINQPKAWSQAREPIRTQEAKSRLFVSMLRICRVRFWQQVHVRESASRARLASFMQSISES